MKVKKFKFGKYQYEYALVREDRKTLSLTVNPNLTVILRTPISASTQRIEMFLKKKWLWLDNQIKYFNKYQKKYYAKEYISGEAFLYLGRQYKLKVVRSKKDDVILKKGVLILETTSKVANGFHNRKILEVWYQLKMEEVFKKRYVEVQKIFNYKFSPILEIRKMTKRWGSFLSQKKVYLNPELIKAPIECIDYVIAHELCHMKYKNHSSEFYLLLKSKIPNWEKVKEKLELMLGWQVKI